MNKTEVAREMTLFLDGARFITKTQIAQFLGYKDDHTATKYVSDLKHIGKRYFVADVAENIVRAGVYGD